MVDVQRIWRITTSGHGEFEVRLAAGPNRERRVALEQIGAESADMETLDLEVARALAQAMLEACEVASALGENVGALR
jgi:hypothetical protein